MLIEYLEDDSIHDYRLEDLGYIDNITQMIPPVSLK